MADRQDVYKKKQPPTGSVKNAVKQSLKDKFVHTWSRDVFSSSKGTSLYIFMYIFQYFLMFICIPVTLLVLIHEISVNCASRTT